MIIYIFTLTILITFVIWGKPLVPHEATFDLLKDLSIVGIGAILGIGIKTVLDLKDKLWVCAVAKLRYHDTYIRVSVAYLFKIYVDGKYLLVKGRNIEQLQPVGGVYKRLPESSKLFNELVILDDKEIPICDTSRHDLRIRVKGKNLHKFISWFESKQDREISHWREFCEELVQPGHLSIDNFPHINYRYLHQNPFYLHWSPYYKCPEVLIHEVYELIPNEKQLQELKNLTASSSTDYQWVDEDTIERLGRSNGTKPFAVAEHANTLFSKGFKVN
ncbi:hypothetical protein DXT99_08290 [Pontibacter diazotrophicus]|uniref:CD-NTase-associated protein 16 NUDIX domain-containing protein n=1 Tax=Pontibacter diazotrophicus TaxID=1400979 RepID=A0A3D8LDK2_9BACT|nr:HU-CCDC81 and SPOR domain-containing protein [Pontibacter diazotrophicus]RDV15485.1 hypothetical protein DXT99_08290 [Pontibacter diazotrophicus]